MQNTKYNEIMSALPHTPCQKIDWDILENSALAPIFSNMEKTEQNPTYHKEGNVLNHTRAVAEALVSDGEFQSLGKPDKEILFLAAILHDIGKPSTVKIENGEITTPRHAVVGAKLAREFMWRTLGLCGNKEAQNIRESVCTLIRYHSTPPHVIYDKSPERKLMRIASMGELASGFSLRKLYLLEKADALGRISTERDDYLERIEYFKMLAAELSILDAPYEFKTPYTARAYFKGKTDWREGELFNESFGEVIITTALPGTGKDTWIKKNCKDMPVVSLDEVRARLGISPTDNQGRVITVATEEMRALLRKRTPFVFNATNITADVRGKFISLFEEYGASVKILFLETEWNEELRRNSSRTSEVPREVIMKMLSRLEVPERYEAERVVWEIT